MPSPLPTRRSPLPYILLALITILTFAPCARNAFTTWDDNDTIARNPDLNPVTPTSFAHFWTRPQGDLYIPVTYTLWAALTPLARTPHPDPTGLTLSPAVYHTFNIILHAATTLLVYSLLRRLTGKPFAAMLGALLFALHPVQVETVAWASGTKDLLAGLLSLAALNLYVAGESRLPPPHNNPGNPLTAITAPLILLATACYALAVLSKPSCVALPIAAAAVGRFLLRRSWRASLVPVLPWFALAIPIIVIGRSAQPAHVVPFVPTVFYRPLIAADAIAFYLRKIVAPISLSIDYGQSPLNVLASPATLYSCLITVALIAALYACRRSRALLAAAAVSLAALLPVLGLIPFDFQQYSTVSDHYLYLAMLGPCLLIAWYLPRQIPWPLVTLALILLGALAARSFARTLDWADSPTLFARTLAANPASTAARTNLAIALTQQDRLADAARQYRAVLHLDFSNAKAHLGLGQLFARAGRPDLALAHLRTAVALQPDNPLAHYNLGLLLASTDHPDDALAQYQRALQLDPNFPEAHTNLATLLLSRGDLDAAERHYRTALQIRPSLTLPQRGLQTIAQLRASQPPTTHP